MAWDESKTWLTGSTSGQLYQALLDDATAASAASDNSMTLTMSLTSLSLSTWRKALGQPIRA